LNFLIIFSFCPHILQAGVNIMPKFMSGHTLPAGAVQRDQLNQLAQAAQQDPVVKPYRSFSNLSEGRVFCIMEAPSKEELAAWFEKMQMPCDYITPVELEGEQRAKITALACSEAPAGHARWDLRLLADKAVELGYEGTRPRPLIRRPP
jgi:hypothetical protein